MDLIFLDIELESVTGIEASNVIRKEYKNDIVQIVFITGKDGYERQLFEYQPLNFISKPLDKNKIQECIKMAYDKRKAGMRLFAYNKDYEKRYIEFDRIICFETDGKNIIMNTDKDKIVFRSSLKQIESQVLSETFIRINQSVIVNSSHIKKYDGKKMLMSNDKMYFVSRGKLRTVKLQYARIFM